MKRLTLLCLLLLSPVALASDDHAADEGIRDHDPFTKPKKKEPEEDCGSVCRDVRSKKASCDQADAAVGAAKRAKAACKSECQGGADKMYSDADKAGGCDGACREQISRWLSGCFTECANEHDEKIEAAKSAKASACKAHSDAKGATKCSCSDSPKIVD